MHMKGKGGRREKGWIRNDIYRITARDGGRAKVHIYFVSVLVCTIHMYVHTKRNLSKELVLKYIVLYSPNPRPWQR